MENVVTLKVVRKTRGRSAEGWKDDFVLATEKTLLSTNPTASESLTEAS